MASTLSQAYKDTPLQLKDIIPLDFKSIRNLPESHVWNPAEDFHIVEKRACQMNVKTLSEYVVPIIDLRAPNVVELIGSACEKWGMFQVTNHGVPLSLVERVESHARRLFVLPTDQKCKALRSPNGATGYGVARISPFFSKSMWHEGFTIIGSAVEHVKKLWPDDYEEFCDAMDNYQKKMKSLSYTILLLILKSLGVVEDQEMFQSEGALQLNSYPCCPNPNQAIGLAPHTDSLLLTILHQSDTNGLQIFQDRTGWIPVPPVAGALVINIGDLMHILSNARFPATYHRVVPNGDRHRFSMAYFYGPSTDAVISPLSNPHSPRFRPVTVKEYISLKNKHLEKALPMLRI